VRKTLFDPVAVEAKLIEQRGSRPPEIVNREWLKGKPSFFASSTTE
jgi:hypothetical protein